MKHMLKFFCLFVGLSNLLAENIYAIPAFARKYSMTCKTCHAPFPKLKPYGDEFAGNGFVLKDKDAPRYYLETGDSELSLLRDIPVALRLEGYVNYNNAKSKQMDLTSPYILKLMSGGELTKNVSYYFYFFYSERGEVAGIEDAFVMYNDLFGSNLDFYIGQFQVSDPLFKRELRLTFEDYQIYKTKIGSSTADLSYDRGIMLTYGFETGTDITLEILNGAGIGPANAARNFDDDKNKNVAGRVSQDISKNVRFGGIGYYGKERKSGCTNSLWMAGGDATLAIEPLEFNFQYLQRKDKNPSFVAGADDIKTQGAFGELILMPNGDDSKWYGVGMFNWVKSDSAAVNYKSVTGHLGYMLKRNIRLAAEYTYNFTNKFGKLGAGMILAF